MIKSKGRKQKSSSANELPPQLCALIHQALEILGYDADALLVEIVELARKDSKLKAEFEEMLLASVEAAVAQVMLRPTEQT